MTNEELQDSARYVLNWAVDSYCRKLEEHIRARGEEIARIEAEREWERANSDGGIGCFDRNPFSSKYSKQKTVDRLGDDLLFLKNVKEFVINKICGQIVEKE